MKRTQPPRFHHNKKRKSKPSFTCDKWKGIGAVLGTIHITDPHWKGLICDAKDIDNTPALHVTYHTKRDSKTQDLNHGIIPIESIWKKEPFDHPHPPPLTLLLCVLSILSRQMPIRFESVADTMYKLQKSKHETNISIAILKSTLFLQRLCLWSRTMLRIGHILNHPPDAEAWFAAQDLLPADSYIFNHMLLFVSHIYFRKPTTYLNRLSFETGATLKWLIRKWESLDVFLPVEQEGDEIVSYARPDERELSVTERIWLQTQSQIVDYWQQQQQQHTEESLWCETPTQVHVQWIHSRAELAVFLSQRSCSELFYCLRYQWFRRPTDEVQGIVIPVYHGRPSCRSWERKFSGVGSKVKFVQLETSSSEYLLLWHSRRDAMAWIQTRIVWSDVPQARLDWIVLLLRYGDLSSCPWIHLVFPDDDEQQGAAFLHDVEYFFQILLLAYNPVDTQKKAAEITSILKTIYMLTRTKQTLTLIQCPSKLPLAIKKLSLSVSKLPSHAAAAAAAAGQSSPFSVAIQNLSRQDPDTAGLETLLVKLRECAIQFKWAHARNDFNHVRIWVQFLVDWHKLLQDVEQQHDIKLNEELVRILSDSKFSISQRLLAIWVSSLSTGTRNMELSLELPVTEPPFHVDLEMDRDLVLMDSCFTQSVSTCEIQTEPLFPTESKEEENKGIPPMDLSQIEYVSSPSYNPSHDDDDGLYTPLSPPWTIAT